MNFDPIYGMSDAEARSMGALLGTAIKPYLRAGLHPAERVKRIEQTLDVAINGSRYKLPKVTTYAFYLPRDNHCEVFFVWADKARNGGPREKLDRYLGTTFIGTTPLDLYMELRNIPTLYALNPSGQGVEGGIDRVVDHMLQMQARAELHQAPFPLFCAARAVLRKWSH